MHKSYKRSSSNARRNHSKLLEVHAELLLRAIRNNGGSLIIRKDGDAPYFRGPGGITRRQCDAAAEVLAERGDIRLSVRELSFGSTKKLAIEAHLANSPPKAGKAG